MRVIRFLHILAALYVAVHGRIIGGNYEQPVMRHRKLRQQSDRPLDETVIANAYLIRFVEGVNVRSKAESSCLEQQVLHVYPHTNALAVTNVSSSSLEVLLDDPDVLFAEPVRN